jgi:hypothetical protein
MSSKLVTIRLDVPLLYLDDKTHVHEPGLNAEDSKPIILSKVLSNALSSLNEGGIKYFHWSLELYKTGVLVLDPTDLEAFKSAVNKLALNNLVKGRILENIEKCEKDKSIAEESEVKLGL